MGEHMETGGQVHVADVEVVTSALEFPEGPVAMPDGSVLVVELTRGTLSRVAPDGTIEVVGECGGGPNGAAVGPDGFVYVCNNGGMGKPDDLGFIQRVDLDSGKVEVIYEEYEGRHLLAPNDLVFDRTGHFWFTDMGGTWPDRYEHGALYYASPDGGSITRGVFPADHPNGVALSQDETRLYWAETTVGRIQRRRITGPGQVEEMTRYDPASIVCGLPGLQMLDSMAVDPDGNVCVATLVSSRITVVEPDGAWVRQITFPAEFHDWLTTNLCFGGPDGRTAYVTFASTGRLLAFRWPELP